MKNENYMVIQGWMINELKLKSNELLVYALIYGFSQDGGSEFKGSKSYIADAIGGCKKTVKSVIKNLMDRELINERAVDLNGVTFKRYKAVKNFPGGVEITPGGGKSYPGGGVEITPNNIDYNIEDNIDLESENLLISNYDFSKCKLKAGHPHRQLIESGLRLFSFFKQKTQNKDLEIYSLREWLEPIKILQKNYNREQIEELVEYANADKFWGAIVLNTDSLQRNFEKIKAQFIKSLNEK